MPTLVGPRVGGAIGARIEIDYTIGYNPEHTAAYVDVAIYVATDRSLSDSTNDWSTWGQFGDAGGSNVRISHGSGGGRTLLRTAGGWFGPGIIGIGTRVSRIEATGNIEAVLYIDPGGLAPSTDGNYYAYNVGPTSFTVGNIIANGNGGSLTNVALWMNTSPSDVGASYYELGGFGDFPVVGRYRATTYWFRLRVANNTWGWGEWGPWRSVTTAFTAPSAPYGYYAVEITQTSAKTWSTNVADTGGPNLNNMRVMVNTSPSEDGATIITAGAWIDTYMNNLNPGTTYYFRVAAANGYAWSNYGEWASFTTLPGVMVKVNGVWRNAIPYVKVNGVWRMATRYVKVNGIWR